MFTYDNIYVRFGISTGVLPRVRAHAGTEATLQNQYGDERHGLSTRLVFTTLCAKIYFLWHTETKKWPFCYNLLSFASFRV